MGTIGIIANPASGKDVRRLIARTSVFDNQEKQAIVGRLLAGILATDPGCRIAYLDDAHGIVPNALREWSSALPLVEPIEATRTGSALDTTSAARSLKAHGCDVVLTLGGDGTNRAVVRGWQNAPLIALSTGTNNVFPALLEATVAGAAAGLIASGAVALRRASHRNKIIHVNIEDEQPDLALIDAVLCNERFVGARALLEPARLRRVLLTRAIPDAVGMTALGGLMHPLDDSDEGGLLIEVGPDGGSWNVPIAPGHYRPVKVTSHRCVAMGETVMVEGPGVLAFDGERERTLRPGQHARLWIERQGPHVVDVPAVLRSAALAGRFRMAQASHSVSS